MDISPIFQLFLALAILIFIAEFFGVLARILKQPRVFGSLLAGVVIGPSVLDFMHWPVFADTPETHLFLEHGIEILAELGVMFLMFNVGLDVHLKELLSVGRAAVFGGTAGALIPTAVTAGLLLAYSHPTDIALFAGVALAATSVSISAQTLLELGVLRTKEGNTVLAAAIVDDVLAILLLSFVTATVVTGTGGEDTDTNIALIAAQMIGYISVAVVVAWYLLPRLVNRLGRYITTRQLVVPTAVVLALLFGWSAEAFGGVAAITGAFIAGAGLSRTAPDNKAAIQSNVSNITYALLAPVFFVSIGLNINLQNFPVEAIIFTLLLLILAVLTKVIGCGLGAKLAGNLNNIEALRVGVCMVSRGEVGLIIMNEGLRRGVFQGTEYVDAALLVVVLLTTVFTPPLVRWAFRLGEKKVEAAPVPGEAGSAP